jgi:hypothetical protein
MARVLIEPIQATVVQAVRAPRALVEARPRRSFLRHSLGWEGMMGSTVVMVVGEMMNHTITHDPVRQAPPEVSALADLVEEVVRNN